MTNNKYSIFSREICWRTNFLSPDILVCEFCEITVKLPVLLLVARGEDKVDARNHTEARI